MPRRGMGALAPGNWPFGPQGAREEAHSHREAPPGPTSLL